MLSGGAGMAGATVKAVNKGNREAFSQGTDGDGAYSLSLPGGDYDMTAAKEGFALDGALTFTLPPGGTLQDGNLRMVPDQGNISGTVASGNSALGGCEVAYKNAANAALAGKRLPIHRVVIRYRSKQAPLTGSPLPVQPTRSPTRRRRNWSAAEPWPRISI